MKLLLIILSITLMGFGERVQETAKGEPTNPLQEFPLASLISTMPPLLIIGKGISGTVSKTVLPNVTVDGVVTKPYEDKLIMTGKYNFTLSAISYINPLGKLVKKVFSSGEVCIPTVPDNFPIVVKIGDMGVRSVLNCTLGTEVTTGHMTWEVTDARNDRILYTTNLTIKDSTGKDIKKTILNYVINGAGEILWTKVVGNMTDNGKAISIIYYGDK